MGFLILGAAALFVGLLSLTCAVLLSWDLGAKLSRRRAC